jgi:hypothetical protein
MTHHSRNIYISLLNYNKVTPHPKNYRFEKSICLITAGRESLPTIAPRAHARRMMRDATITDHDAVATAMISSIVTRGEEGCASFFVRPAELGRFDASINSSTVRSLYNSDVPALAYRASNFIWALYGFNSGHFPSTIIKRNLPFHIVLACVT